MNKFFDPTMAAEFIIADYVSDMISGIHCEPKGNKELYDHMVEGTAYILSQKLIKREISPLNYNAVQNELGRILWDIFQPYAEESETWGDE